MMCSQNPPTPDSPAGGAGEFDCLPEPTGLPGVVEGETTELGRKPSPFIVAAVVLVLSAPNTTYAQNSTPTPTPAPILFADGFEPGDARRWSGSAPASTCGNFVLEVREACDDANQFSGDTCNPTCTLTNSTSLFAGSPGISGDLDGPDGTFSGLVDFEISGGTLYFGDGPNFKVRSLDLATGTFDTIAGNGVSAVVDHPEGIQASFGSAISVAANGTYLWVGDPRVLRRITLNGTNPVTTVAGKDGVPGIVDGIGDAARLEDPRGLVYFEGLVYFTEASAGVVRSFDPATGQVTTLAGAAYQGSSPVDGVGGDARFVSPRYTAVDPVGRRLFISDTNGASIRVMDLETLEVTTFAGNGVRDYQDGVGDEVRVDRPRGLAWDGTSLYWAEFNEHTIRQAFGSAPTVGTLVGEAGNPGGYVEGQGDDARFDMPFDVVYDPATGSLYVADAANKVVRRID